MSSGPSPSNTQTGTSTGRRGGDEHTASESLKRSSAGTPIAIPSFFVNGFPAVMAPQFFPSIDRLILFPVYLLIDALPLLSLTPTNSGITFPSLSLSNPAAADEFHYTMLQSSHSNSSPGVGITRYEPLRIVCLGKGWVETKGSDSTWRNSRIFGRGSK
jgi:hypothetical protein